MSFFFCFIIRDSALTFNESVQTSLLFFCRPTLTHISLSLPHSRIEPGSHCDEMFFAYNIKSSPKNTEVSFFSCIKTLLSRVRLRYQNIFCNFTSSYSSNYSDKHGTHREGLGQQRMKQCRFIVFI